MNRLAGMFFASGLLALANLAAAQNVTGGLQPSVQPQAKEVATTESPSLVKADGMLMLDYQVIPVRGGKSLNLIGFHVLHKFNDWLHVGLGGHAPLFKGEYGGFMAFDVTAHVQRRVWGNVFANAGISLGGGGGGKSVAHSRVLSGTGGFTKTYAGLGYDFQGFSVGTHITRMKFKDSAIDHSQLNVYFQKPFSYAIGPYASAGEKLSAADRGELRQATADSIESQLTIGVDNMVQIKPQGTNKETIGIFDLQYSHFVTPSSYWFFNAAGGFRGRPAYNQAFGGMGVRSRISPRVNLYGQLGIGSGGYAPEVIDTGAGLLLYPKVSAEVMVDKNLGLSLSAGYIAAPTGSSKNTTVGAALRYHLRSGDQDALGSADGVRFRGYRLNVTQQTQSDVVYRSAAQPDVKLLTLQIDSVLGEHLYLPIQIGAATNAYLNLPGYGELLAGVGLQSRHRRGDRVQVFGQFLVGANPHGAVYKTGVGLNVSLSDRWALYGMAGQTFSGWGAKKDVYRSNQLGLGLSYRFSVPNR